MKSPRNDSSMLHPSAEVLPYGFWPSDWSAEAAAAASRDFAELRAGQGGLFDRKYDPAEGRCSLWFWQAGQACCVTPAGYSVRSRVYEYGGGAFCLTGQGLAFVNEADQQIYLQTQADPEATSLPAALTERPGCRYGDLQYDPKGAAVIALEESSEDNGILHRLVAFTLSDGARRILVEGPTSTRRPC